MNLFKLKQNILSSLKIITLSLMLSVGLGYALAQSIQPQWTQPTGSPPAGNMPLPISTHVAPQVKDGPLTINLLNTGGDFGFRVPYSGIGIGSITFPTGALGAGDLPGLLHISNDQQPGSEGSFPAIRIDGPGPALVAPSTDAKIGLGTLNPAYNLDIPTGTARIYNLRIGHLQMIGLNCVPAAGKIFTAYTGTLNGGWGCWADPTVPSPIFNNAPRLNVLPVEVIDQNWPTGNNVIGFANLRPGVWYVRVFGVIGQTSSSNPYRVTVTINGGITSSGASADKSFDITNHPDGTAPFSVAGIFDNRAAGSVPTTGLFVNVDDDLAQNHVRPKIMGVTAYWMSQ